MILKDASGRTYSPLRKFGDSCLPTPSDDWTEGQYSLSRLYSPEGQLLVPAGDGMFKVQDSGEMLIVVQR